MKILIYSTLLLALISCSSIKGAYKWASCDPVHTEIVSNNSSEQKKEYGPWDVFEIKLNSFGRMQFRFTNLTSDGGVAITQDRPMNDGKWDINGDTLSIFYTTDKNDTPNLYLISADTLIPINNNRCWQKN